MAYVPKGESAVPESTTAKNGKLHHFPPDGIRLPPGCTRVSFERCFRIVVILFDFRRSLFLKMETKPQLPIFQKDSDSTKIVSSKVVEHSIVRKSKPTQK